MSVFDYVEIGTSNFDTFAQSNINNTSKGLSIEPIKELIDELPKREGWFFLNAALGNSNGKSKIYRVSREDQEKYKLPDWVDSSSSIGLRNPNVLRVLKEKQLPDSLFAEREINIVNWSNILSTFSIKGIKDLKVDAEGMDIDILLWFFESIPEDFELPFSIKFEAREEMTDKKKMNILLDIMREKGYKFSRAANDIFAHLTK